MPSDRIKWVKATDKIISAKVDHSTTKNFEVNNTQFAYLLENNLIKKSDYGDSYEVVGFTKKCLEAL